MKKAGEKIVMKARTRAHWALIGGLALLPVGAAVVVPRMLPDLSRLDLARVAAAGREHADFTVERRAAQLSAIRAQQHPLWRTLSPAARAERAAALAVRWLRWKDSTGTPTPALAPFRGNRTFIFNPSGNALALQRMPDCSLSLYYGQYTVSGNSATVQITQATPHYEQTLHAAAGLATQADVFAGGCADPTLGIGSRRGAYLGTTSTGALFGVGTGFNPAQQANALYYGAVDLASTAPQTGSGADFSLPGIHALAAGDLNGDGVADVVGLDGSSGDVKVWLASGDGSFASSAPYSLGGTTAEGAVIADVNGDGKPDVVVVTRDAAQHEQLWVLTGDGSGTLVVGQPQAIPTPTNSSNEPVPISTLIAADLRGNGRDDLVGANGLVLLNDGTGNFTAAPQPAFAAPGTSSAFGPNLAAGDFNADGKLDLALDDGAAIHIYEGNGDGTFTPGASYASDTDIGYVTATDLDGDGNVDLYVGLADGGVFGGDQFGPNQAYAVMGNGDGTFGGAPAVPFVYTGTNLADLNGDGHIDAVGVNADESFTTYLGDGKGNFSPKSTLQTSPLTYNGTQYPLGGIDSFGLADVNGDGNPDLVFLATGLVVRPPQGFDTPGILVALGDGKGGFAAPTFIPSGHFVPGSDVDGGAVLSGLRLADVNHDGKADLVFSFTDTDITTGTAYQGIAVQLGNGDGTFQSPQTLVLPYDSSATYHVIGFADLNKDGNPDLLFTTAHLDQSNTEQIGLEVALGNGDGTFAAPMPVTTTDVMPVDVFDGTQYAPIVVADMNGDGIPDIVALGEAGNGSGFVAGSIQVAIALGNGDGTFKAPIKTTYAASYNQEGLAVADFNGDGKLDVAITGPLSPDDSGITFGNGDGTLQPLSGANGLEPNEVFYLANLWGAAVAADFDGDGKPDLLAGQTLLLNLGSSGSATPDFSISASPAAITATAGQSATTTLTITPSGGFDESIALSCSGLPAGASCTFSPSTVTPSGSAVSVTLSIATAPQSGMLWLGGAGSALASIGLALIGRRKRYRPEFRRSAATLRTLALAGVACGVLLAACGGDSSGSGTGSSSSSSSSSASSSASSSTVTVTATASSPTTVTHTATITLTVQ